MECRSDGSEDLKCPMTSDVVSEEGLGKEEGVWGAESRRTGEFGFIAG